MPFDSFKGKEELLNIHENQHKKFKNWVAEKQHLPLEELEKEVYEFIVNKNDFADILVLAEEDARTETSEVNPLTAYAKSKVFAERERYR